jgi:alkylation response protein AidB-like acyl-CoA dehydrogenase
MMVTLTEEQQQIVATVRRFIEREVKPVASEMEHRDEYPHGLVERMRELA